MLDLAADFVAQAASNPLVVFCFCNLLIVIILMAPKPSSNSEETSEFHLPILTHNSVIDDQRIDTEQPTKNDETSPEVMELCVSENLEKEDRSHDNGCEVDNEDDGEKEDRIYDKGCEVDNKDVDNEDDGEKEDRIYDNGCEVDNEDDGESTNDDDNDDELRRRVEAFIDKVNREWKAEILRTHSLCEQVDS